jgi:NADP-dependent 3-hydroxy acid dehydrogenase YdfG
MSGPSDKVREDRWLTGRVMVVTGASAGVGRAVAHAAGRAGAKVALIARSRSALETVRAELEAEGAQALVLPLDVADPVAVVAAASKAAEVLGPLDYWVNAAMATVFSPLERVTPEELKRVTDVTYLGSAYGVLAALAFMRPRNRGVIVQVGSALAFRGIPLQAPYCAAKHAIHGFIGSTRTELIHERSAIKLVEVHLPAVNTPQFTWARKHLSETPKPVGKIYSPEAAAGAILDAAKRPRGDVWFGGTTAQTILGQAIAPQLLDRFVARKAWEGQFTGAPSPPRAGNLFEPDEGRHAIHGPFTDQAHAHGLRLNGPRTRLAAATAGAIAMAVLGAVAARATSGRRSPGPSRG